MAGYEGYSGEYVARIVGRATIVLGADLDGEAHTLPMEGSIRIREWPYPGFERRTLPDGRVQIDLEMVEQDATGRVEALGMDIAIRRTQARSLGTLTQMTPGEDFPAAFALWRMVQIQTPFGDMFNEQPIDVRATLTSIPPVVGVDTESEPNVFEAVNTPLPLWSSEGRIVAFLSGSAENRTNCVARIVGAEQIARG